MIIRETPWERENLGVKSSAVFQFEESDTIQTVSESVLNNRDYIYQEATLPMNKIDILNRLLSAGFSFAEVAIHLSVTPEDLTLPVSLKRRMALFSCRLADEDETNTVFESMKNGEVFQTDKIALNPHFGPKVAGERYARWSKNMIESGRAEVHIVTYRDENMGFFILTKVMDNTVDGLLAGLFDNEKYKGFGYFLGALLIEQSKSMGAKKITGNVSSNNPSVLKLNQMLGYKVESMKYVLSRLIE